MNKLITQWVAIRNSSTYMNWRGEGEWEARQERRRERRGLGSSLFWEIVIYNQRFEASSKGVRTGYPACPLLIHLNTGCLWILFKILQYLRNDLFSDESLHILEGNCQNLLATLGSGSKKKLALFNAISIKNPLKIESWSTWRDVDNEVSMYAISRHHAIMLPKQESSADDEHLADHQRLSSHLSLKKMMCSREINKNWTLKSIKF